MLFSEPIDVSLPAGTVPLLLCVLLFAFVTFSPSLLIGGNDNSTFPESVDRDAMIQTLIHMITKNTNKIFVQG